MADTCRLADDCSTDSTPDICRHYARKYPDKIRYIANSVNKGVVDNYFDCVLDARGEYIADCAGDDFWTDEYKLQKQTELLESNSDVVLVHTDWMYYDIKSGDMYPPSTTRKERTLFRNKKIVKYAVMVIVNHTLRYVILTLYISMHLY